MYFLTDQLQSAECQDSWDDSVVKTTAPSPLSFGEQLDQLHFIFTSILIVLPLLRLHCIDLILLLYG